MSQKPSTDKTQNKTNSEEEPSSGNSGKKPGIFSVLQSVMAAMFGVQSEAKRQQDFETGSAADYIFVGIIMVIIFVVSIIWFVQSTIADYQTGG